jgi:ATP-dependent protease ClpP protease subunit
LIRVIGEINASTLYEYFIQCDCDNVDSILISSPGGDIGYTLAMLDDIDEHKRTTRATGICQSAAAVLATAGEGKRTCTMDTLFRFIPPAPEPVKNPETGILEDKVPDLRWFLHTVLVARLAQRLGRNKVEIYELFDGEFISSTRALELGLVDEVISTEASNGDPSGLSRSEGEAPAPDEVGGYDSYAPTPTRSSGDIRIQPTAEKGETGDYIGWNF